MPQKFVSTRAILVGEGPGSEGLGEDLDELGDLGELHRGLLGVLRQDVVDEGHGLFVAGDLELLLDDDVGRDVQGDGVGLQRIVVLPGEGLPLTLAGLRPAGPLRARPRQPAVRHRVELSGHRDVCRHALGLVVGVEVARLARPPGVGASALAGGVDPGRAALGLGPVEAVEVVLRRGAAGVLDADRELLSFLELAPHLDPQHGLFALKLAGLTALGDALDFEHLLAVEL